MRHHRALPWVIGFEVVGFLLVILIVWLDEYLDLPHRLFHAAATPLRPAEFRFEAAAVLLLGTLVVTSSVRAFRRIAYLESLLVMCAWCRRVSVDGQWMSLERFLDERNAIKTSHGMCPACFAEFGEGGKAG